MVRYLFALASTIALGCGLAGAYASTIHVAGPARISSPREFLTVNPSTRTRPKIKKISRIIAAQTQQITILGENFGTYYPYFGDSPYLWMDDLGIGQQPNPVWRAGCAGAAPCGTTINVTSWTDTQIVVAGFGGSYSINPIRHGDTLVWQVINPQTNGRPAGLVVYAR